MIIDTAEQREIVIEAGKRLGTILETLQSELKVGMSTATVDARADELIRAGGDLPVFKGYQPDGAPYPFPGTLCISINDEVVHGIPKADRLIKEGDIVTLDLGLSHHGYLMDSAVTVPVGTIPTESQKLLNTTQASLYAGIAAARPGARVGDISHAIEASFKGSKFSLVKILGGHAIGHELHEEPFIPNVGHAGTGEEIVAGMLLALEPIANAGKGTVLTAPDGWTYRTRDGSRSAHFEHTILVGEDETIVLTRRPGE